MLRHADGPLRILLAMIIAAIIVAAMPQAADAALTKRQRCIAAAERALGQDITPSDYRIVLGTNKATERFYPSSRKDLICGFGGTDWVRGTMRTGDVFIAGTGTSYVVRMEGGLVVGGPDLDIVDYMSGGRFYGGKGYIANPQDARGDTVSEMRGGVFYGGPGRDDVMDLYGGRFVGGRGYDWVGFQRGGTFLGKRGRDQVDFLQRGRFKGGPHGDRVDRAMTGGVFNGGPGSDTVKGYEAGTLYSVEVCKKPTNPCP